LLKVLIHFCETQSGNNIARVFAPSAGTCVSRLEAPPWGRLPKQLNRYINKGFGSFSTL